MTRFFEELYESVFVLGLGAAALAAIFWHADQIIEHPDQRAETAEFIARVAIENDQVSEIHLQDPDEQDRNACSIDGIETETVYGFSGHNEDGDVLVHGVVCRLTAAGNLFATTTRGN